ncbi:glycine-rich domain-containing protein [Chryseobacterium sp. JK1]|uniref:glycine-rich domain-containing protein n=1 Tax=Chryseobacterium sp. JK1 TaxID=874294 RepID=UPI003D699056
MKTKLILQDESLWKRIQGFSLDASDADFPFSKKLAKEEKWSLDFAQKAIEEYKKFVYLCCILPYGASPSETVDKVWHMHLIYTQNYWEEFCPKILKRNLHHHPSKGGNTENIKHKVWFSETLKHYHEIFKKEAPQEIWSTYEKPKSSKNLWKRLRLVSLFAALLMLSSCLGEIISSFTAIFLSIVGILGFGLLVSVLQGNEGPNKKDDGSSCGGSSCSGGSSCGSGCGGGCGGCGGCGG